MKRKFIFLAVLVSIVILGGGVAAAVAARQCDEKAVAYCGAYTGGELEFKIAHGDGKNSAANLQQVFFKENRGITNETIRTSKDGEVLPNGEVKVGGKVVATGASVASRENTSGSTKDGSLYVRPASAALGNDTAAALVDMSSGKFGWAVVKKNGNIVKLGVAKAAPAPAATPTPAPTAAPVPQSGPAAGTDEVPSAGATGEEGPLPTSGPAEVLAGTLGISAVWYALWMHRRSKRRLLGAMRHRY